MVTIVDFLAQAVKNKPTDGSDCKSLTSAQKELGRLRRITGKVVKVLSNARDLAALNGNSNGAIAPAPQAQDHAPDEKMSRPSVKKRKALTIDQSFKIYKKITVEKSSEERVLIKSAIKNNALFTELLDDELEDFVDVFAPKSFKRGHTVIKQGDIGHQFFVVQSGMLDIFINLTGKGDVQLEEKQVGVPYRRGGAFGELALLYESPRAATIRASEDCILWIITRTAFKGLQLHIEQEAHERKLKQLQSVRIGKKVLGEVMDLSQLESMAMATQYQKFHAGATIVHEGENGNTFYMITKGEVDVYKHSAGPKPIASLGLNSFFGEKALLGRSGDTRQASCVAALNTECLTLTRDDFILMLGNLEDVLAGRRESMLNKSTQMTPSFFVKQLSDNVLTLKDLKMKRVLGEGAFGKVNLVKSRTDGKLYALKAQGKAHIVENTAQEKLITEYRLMLELSHPFIVQCFQAFQCKKYIYFLMGLLPGGEVLDLLDEHKKFSEDWSRFYCGAVVLVFEYLHQQKIAYRDLKPENLVLDEEGYCVVVDFGLAKRCDRGKTWTMCGTPDYLAPEIITGKGHDWGVDYWALGVFVYELTHGYPPFYDDDPTKTAKKVMKGTYDIPDNFSRALIDLVSRLLSPQAQRLGRTQGGVRKIRKHAWFEGFNWQGLLDREIKVPHVPKLGNLEKLGTKDDGKWDAPPSRWEPDLNPSTGRRESWSLTVFNDSDLRTTITTAIAAKKFSKHGQSGR